MLLLGFDPSSICLMGDQKYGCRVKILDMYDGMLSICISVYMQALRFFPLSLLQARAAKGVLPRPGLDLPAPPLSGSLNGTGEGGEAGSARVLYS